MDVTLAESAIRDLQAILDHYTGEGVAEVGLRLVETIVDRIEDLQHYPDMGRAVPEFDSPAIRELIQPPFRIVYRRQPDRVQVVRVWRSERELKLP